MRKVVLVSQTTTSLVHWAEKYDVVGLSKQEISMTRRAKASSSHAPKGHALDWKIIHPNVIELSDAVVDYSLYNLSNEIWLNKHTIQATRLG